MSTRPKQKVCPFCAESMKVEAVVCPHCRRDLPKSFSLWGLAAVVAIFVVVAVYNSQRSLPATEAGAPTASGATAAPSPEAIETPALLEKSSFPINEVDARELAESLGPSWKEVMLMDSSADSFSGGFSRMIIGKSGSSDIFTLANGQVWDLQLRSGIGDRCGSPANLDSELPRIIWTVAPSLSVTDDQIAELRRGLRKLEPTKIRIGDVGLTTMGGCLPLVDIRVHWSSGRSGTAGGGTEERLPPLAP